jgi:Fe-S cluster assembly ATPase SufC
MNYTHANRTKNKFKTQKMKKNIQNLEKQLNSSSSGGEQKRRTMKKRKQNKTKQNKVILKS